MKGYRVFRTSDSSRPVHISLHYVESCEEINEKEVILKTKSGQKYYVYGNIKDVMAAVADAQSDNYTVLSEEKEGLTLRDQFAMAVLPKMIVIMALYSVAVREAYKIADEMMIAREQKGVEA